MPETEEGDLASAVRMLVDESEIRALLARYARGIDRMDFELVRSCYEDGATDDHGAFRGDADDFVAHLREVLPGFESSQHFLGTQLIEIDGDEARAETYCLALLRQPQNGGDSARDRSRKLRYCDRLTRRSGQWKILERVVALDNDRVDFVTVEPPDNDQIKGRRDGTDPAVAPVLPRREPQSTPWT